MFSLRAAAFAAARSVASAPVRRRSDPLPEGGAIVPSVRENASTDDGELLRRIGVGNGAALAELYERHSESVRRFLSYRLRDPFEAEDLAQEVFLEIWRSAARFEGRSEPRTWIFGIARNKAVDRLRRGGREMTVPAPGAMIADEAPDPETAAAAAQDAARLRACVAKLGDAHRSAIRLAYFGELPYDEIAAIEGVPVGTIKTRMMHARRLLRRDLASHFPR